MPILDPCTVLDRAVDPQYLQRDSQALGIKVHSPRHQRSKYLLPSSATSILSGFGFRVPLSLVQSGTFHKGSSRALYPEHISLERLSAQSRSQRSRASILTAMGPGLGCVERMDWRWGKIAYYISWSSILLSY